MLRIGVCASGGGGNLKNLFESRFSNSHYVIEKVLVDRVCGAIEVAKKFETACVIAEDSPSIADNIDLMFEEGCDLLVLAGFMPILSAEICQRYNKKIVNTHPSLLPRHGGRGMYGVRVQEAVLAENDTLAGCTVHFVDETIDGGEIIIQIGFPVPPGISAWELGGRVFQAESMALPLALSFINQESMR
jgi:phosphoribosylglycinamide formyltransferase-1